MNAKRFIISGLLICCTLTWIKAQDENPIPTASAVEVYKSVGDVDLKAWIFNPPKHEAGAKRPAIVFFFGGGWRGGTPTQFVKHGEYLAARGMVAITVDYRVASRHGVKAVSCVADAKSAIRWMRQNADRLGIDPNRIVAAGGSAGGHLAASTATLPGHDESSDDASVSAVPNALALFNPAVLLAEVPGKMELTGARMASLASRLGAEPESMSPYHHVRPGIAPTIIFHGTADTTVPLRSVELFKEAMDAKGNPCTLVSYVGQGHGFFNFGRELNGAFISTLSYLDDFLVGLGYLQAAPISKVK